MRKLFRVTILFVPIVVLLLVSAINLNRASASAEAVYALEMSEQNTIVLPDFRLPWPKIWSGRVYFVGGPHEWGNTTFGGEYIYGKGSGLDFTAGDKGFLVLAMASGRVVAIECDEDTPQTAHPLPGLGCIVTIKHDVGDSYLTYGHLCGCSYFFHSMRSRFQAGEDVRVEQGSPLDLTGATGSGSDGNNHLHLELRNGSVNGSAIGWEQMELLNGQIDGYWIYGYANGDPNNPNIAYDEHENFYNYDGVAVKGHERKVIRDFRYVDVPGQNRDDVVTYVGSNFLWPRDDCLVDCESQTDPGTQFARTGGGGFWNQSLYSLNGPNALDSESSGFTHGVLESTNEEPRVQSDGAGFIRDITIPDGFVASPGQSLTKTWRMHNTGSTSWGGGYQLVFVGGEQMGAPGAVSVPATAPGQEVNISVNITAPSSSGEHKGYWQLRNSQGTYFGPRIWVEITVPGGDPPVTTDYILTCQNCPSSVPPGDQFRPTLQAAIGSGQLLPSRGDMVRHSGGDLFGAWPHVIVTEIVNAGESTDFTFYADNPITAPDTPGTYESKWRLWQNGDWAGPEYTIRFEVKEEPRNNPPHKPTLVDPGDWGVFTSTPTLSAQHNGDPDGDAVTHYYFDVFESHDIPKSGWITSSNWTPPGLGYYGYQWRVKVRDSKGAESEWSEVRHFNIKNPTPQIYSFSSQWCHEPWGPPDKICFCAETSGGGLELKVNSATDGSDSGTWNTIGHGDTNFRCQTDDDRPPNWGQLEHPAGQYRVRLYQRPNVGGWDAANTADTVVTVPANQRPGPPFGRLPENLSYVDTRTVHFDWVDTYRTTSYRLQASTDSGFGSTLLDTTLPVGTSEYTHTFNSDHETVYWRVTASGPYGTNDAAQRFHIDRTPPTSAVSGLPAVSTETSFSVNWSGSDARSGLRWYHIQVRDGDRPGTEWNDWLVNTTKTAEIFQGQAGHKYFFRSRAMDEIGNWEAWPAGDGDTSTLVDPSAVPAESWWNHDYAWKHNLVILNNDGDYIPAHYPMHIQLNSSTTPTAAEIYSASLASTRGNDVRIVFRDQTELNRVVTSFTSSAIDIWFPLQANLSGGASNSADYQIYYGNAVAGNPPRNVNSVFLPETDGNTVALWHFHEGSGSSLGDSSGRGHTATFYNAGWINGLLGKAGRLNGSNAYADAGTTNDFNLGSGPMTLEAWIYLTGSTGAYPHIISKWGPDGSYFWRVTGGRNLHWLMRADGGNREVYSSTVLELNRWYHVAATYNGSNTLRVYVNGNMAGQSTNGADAFNSTRRFLIGYAEGGADGAHFPGDIQHVRVSNTERTSFPYGRIDVQPSTALGIARPRPVSGSADLVLLDLQAFPDTEGGLIVEATVRNEGTRDTQNGFSTDIYVDHLPTGAQDYTGSISFWVNDKIEPDQTVTLTTVLESGSVALQGLNLRLAVAGETTGTLYAQVDTDGVVTEPDDANNIHDQGVEFCLADADSFEGDDSPAVASPLALDEIQTHNFSKMDDEDWVQFTAQAGRTYRLSTSGLATAADTYLYLYDTDGTTLLAANDDNSESLASTIIWIAPADGAYYAVVSHWNPNAGGCDNTYSLQLTEAAVTHGIQLATGWNMLSTYVTPEDLAMDAIFPIPERDDLELCKDHDGNIYWPAYGIDTIVNWDPARGYKCYTSQGFSIGMYGLPIDSSEPIELDAGWSMVAYWRDIPMPVEDTLASLGDSLVLAKTSDGKIYWPDYGINTIGDMQPGQGYKLYLSAAATLVYPAD